MNNNFKLMKWLEKTFFIKPKKISLYIEALTHQSYSNENKLSYSYQRLEFLGDSVINMLAAKYLFFKFQKNDEGFLTNQRKLIVQSNTEIAIAKKINLRNYIFFGKGARNLSNVDKILEDCFESIIGAIYLDYGIEKTENILKHTLFSFHNKEILEKALDYKTLIQESLIKHNNPKNMIYHTWQCKNNLFQSVLKINKIIYGKGIGKNKKIAEKMAAKNAYKKLIRI